MEKNEYYTLGGKYFFVDTVFTPYDIKKFRARRQPFTSDFRTNKEEELADELYRLYVGMFEPVKFGQFLLIEDLIDAEVYLYRTKKMLRDGEMSRCRESMDTIHRFATHVNHLKERLGVFPKKENEKPDNQKA